MSAKIFLSTVSDEFRAYRDQLRADLTRHNVEVKVQEDFKDLGGDTLDKLDVYIAHCDAVVHLAGDMTGSDPGEHALSALRAKYPDLADKLPPLGEALRNGSGVSYTQWEAWLALYHGKLLFIAKAADSAERGPKYMPTDASRAAQAAHLARLKAMDRYPGCTFASPDDLAKHIAYTAILDLLVKDYAEQTARERDVAEGFIKEMAKRVAGDKALDFDGMKQQVQKAIEIYETEIAGRPIETNIDAIVDAALAKARAQVDQGQSRLARATLRQGRRGDAARGGGAPRALCRGRDAALQSRARHCARCLRRRRRGRRHCCSGRSPPRGERGDDRDIPQFGSGDARRLRPRSRQQRASRRFDRAAVETIGARFIRRRTRHSP